jgi:hypothetical protein
MTSIARAVDDARELVAAEQVDPEPVPRSRTDRLAVLQQVEILILRPVGGDHGGEDGDRDEDRDEERAEDCARVPDQAVSRFAPKP